MWSHWHACERPLRALPVLSRGGRHYHVAQCSKHLQLSGQLSRSTSHARRTTPGVCRCKYNSTPTVRRHRWCCDGDFTTSRLARSLTRAATGRPFIIDCLAKTASQNDVYVQLETNTTPCARRAIVHSNLTPPRHDETTSISRHNK